MRRQLVERLERSVAGRPVTVVSAPSGHGKSTIVGVWATNHPTDVAWLSLSRFDSDESRLMAGVVAALRTVALRPEREDIAAVLAIGPDPDDTAAVYSTLTDALDSAARPVFLVLDDAHRASDALTSGLLGELLEHPHPALRILLVGNTYLDPVLARLLLSDPDAFVRAPELAFTAAEVGELMVRHGVPGDAGGVMVETDGWPIAVRFLLLGGTTGTPHGDWRPDTLRDYVRRHVLAAVPPELVDFILDLSVCDDVTPELAVAVSGRPEAPALLEACVQRGMFLDRFQTGAGPVYRWHAVFSEQCRAILASTADGRIVARHRAAAAHLARSEPLAAIPHWLAAGAVADAVETILDGWVGLIIGDEPAALDAVCAALPDPIADDPRILLVRSCAQDVLGSHQLARTLFARAQAVAGAGLAPEGYRVTLLLARLFLTDDRSELAGASAAVRAEVARSDWPASYDRTSALFLLAWTEMRLRNNPPLMLELLGAVVVAAEAQGRKVLAQRARGLRAFTLAFAGNLVGARKQRSELAAGADDEESPWASYLGGAADPARGLVAYFENDMVTAQHAYLAALRSGNSRYAFSGITRVLFSFAAAASRDPHSCRRAADELRALPTKEIQGLSWPEFRRITVAALEEALGRRDRAVAVARQFATVTDLPVCILVLSGILRRSGDPLGALQMLRGMDAYAGVPYLRAATLITAALVQRRRGGDR